MEHSKTPWTVNEHLSLIRDAYGNALASLPYTLGDEQDRANAEFIVRAVNSHDELLEACEFAFEWLENLRPINFDALMNAQPDRGGLIILRKAIRKAKGE